MLQNQIISYARTAVMLGVGYLLTFLAAHFDIVISEHSRTLVAAGVAFVVAFAYYVIVRALEARWPKLGVLLGVPAKPEYPAVATPAPKGDAGLAGALLLVVVLLLAFAVLGGLFVHPLLWLIIIAAIVVAAASRIGA